MIRRLARTLFAAGIVFSVAYADTSFAQFSKAVAVVKGSVITESSGQPISVKVSVRAVGDTATEVTASRSNSETGQYLVVLKPGKKYWFHLESPDIIAKDTLVETPASDKTVQITHDFTVTSLRGEQMGLVGTPIEVDIRKQNELE